MVAVLSQGALPLRHSEGEARKMAGIEEVMENESRRWKDLAMSAVIELAKRNRTLTADDIREACAELGEPHHPNVWGGLTKSAQARGYISRTSKTVLSRRSDAHARAIPVWKSLIRVEGGHDNAENPPGNAPGRRCNASIPPPEPNPSREKVCAAQGCDNRFVPYRKSQLYCCYKCRWTDWGDKHPRL
jgi:hypothetical protein